MCAGFDQFRPMCGRFRPNLVLFRPDFVLRGQIRAKFGQVCPGLHQIHADTLRVCFLQIGETRLFCKVLSIVWFVSVGLLLAVNSDVQLGGNVLLPFLRLARRSCSSEELKARVENPHSPSAAVCGRRPAPPPPAAKEARSVVAESASAHHAHVTMRRRNLCPESLTRGE